MTNTDIKELSQLTDNFDDFEVDPAKLLYSVCMRGPFDFGPPVLKLFRYRKLARWEIVFLNCARWIEVSGMKLTARDEREHRRIHYIIVGEPDEDGGSSGAGDPDTGPDDGEMCLFDFIRTTYADDEEEETKSSPAPLVQQPAPPAAGLVVKAKKAKPIARPVRKPSGPEID
jgi:hypothetical protein